MRDWLLSWWAWVLSFFVKAAEPPAPAEVTVTLALPAPVEELKPELKFVKTFVCGCGATMRIRSRDRRDDGPSNFKPYPPAHPKRGHAQQPAELLNWAGLAAERGWTDKCPACQRGMTVPNFKMARKLGRLK